MKSSSLLLSLLIAPCALSATAATEKGADKPAIAARNEAVIPHTSDLQRLLVSAIDAPSGEKQAWLEGDVANKLMIQTQAPPATPVLVTISTLMTYRPGCKRMRMLLAEPSHLMATIKGTKEPFAVYYDLNICRDGRPPQDSKVGLGK